MEFLYEYDFEVFYIQEKENVMEDALSHRWHEVATLSLGVDLSERILGVLPRDTWYLDVRVVAESGRPLEGRYSGYTLESHCLLRHLGWIYVPPLEGLHILIMTEAHHAPYSAHPGVKKMHTDLRQIYHWAGMKCEIADFVSKCLEYQQMKVEHQHLVGLLQPKLMSDWKWDIISMDFIVGLPVSSRRHDTIMVIVDRLTKVSHFVPIRSSYTVAVVARVFLEDVVRLHGIPRQIIFYRDPVFTSALWTSL